MSPPAAEDPRDPAPDDRDRFARPPVTPHAAPSLDAEGRLTYVGSDGRRYVVAEPPEPGSAES